jgi:hypothetical protein
MKRFAVFAALLAFSAAGIALADGTTTTSQYLGAGKCKACHMSAKKGAQFKVWSESKHAHAFLELSSPKAMEIAKAKGIADPTKAAECLGCHVTGSGEPADHFAASFSESLGVQCESCHGAGSSYYKRTVMIDARTKKIDPATVGLQMPTKDTCAHCHNEKATSGKFVDWPADSAKIAHPIPAGADADDAGAKE